MVLVYLHIVESLLTHKPQTPAEQRRQTYSAIENGTNDVLLVLVAGAGFFTDSYLVRVSSLPSNRLLTFPSYSPAM